MERVVLVVFLALTGCEGSERDLFVDLKTDYVPGVEFTTVRTTIFDALPTPAAAPLTSRERSAFEGEEFVGGVRVAEVSLEVSGTAVARTELVRPDGTILTSRVSRVTLESESVGVTVLISRDCGDVVCPNTSSPTSFTECWGGRCVSPDCVEENVAACGDAVCASDGECTPVATCAIGRCVVGACLLEADDSRCASNETCDLELGCRERSPLPDAATDADGDAGLDADAGPVTFDLEGQSFTVAPHLVVELEAPVLETSPILDPSWPHGLVTPPAGSAFPPGLYLATGLEGTAPPTVFRIADGTVSIFAQPTTEPTINFNAAAFAPPTSAYGDYLYLCSFETGTLDGLFRVDAAGSIERFSDVGSCTGLDFDATGAIDGVALYSTLGNDQIVRVDSAGVSTVLDTTPPDINGTLSLLVPQSGRFLGQLLLVSDGDWDVVGDGYLGTTTGGMPWESYSVYSSGHDPLGAVTTNGPPFGDAWLVNMGSEVVAFTSPTDRTPILWGMTGPGALALSNDGETLWVVASNDGRILRLRAR